AMEVVPACLAADAEPACFVRAAAQPPLHLFADPGILLLNLIGNGDAPANEVPPAGTIGIRKVKIENDAAGGGAQRQDQVRVDYPLVDIHHEIGKDPPVVGTFSSTDLTHIVIPWFKWTDLYARHAADLGAIARVVDDAGEARVHGVDVVTAVQIVIDVDLPVA